MLSFKVTLIGHDGVEVVSFTFEADGWARANQVGGLVLGVCWEFASRYIVEEGE